MNPEFPPEFHVRRGMILSKMYEEEKIKRMNQEEMLFKQESTLNEGQKRMKRFHESIGLLTKGFSIGAFSGLLAGTVYAIKTKSPTVLTVSLYSAFQLGSLTTLFTSFKILIPQSFDRKLRELEGYQNNSSSLVSLFNAPGMMPGFFSDLTNREADLLSTFVSGSISGSIMTFLNSLRIARSNNLTVGHVGSTGLKGGLFWGSTFTLLHFSYFYAYDCIKAYKLNNKIREISLENPKEFMDKYGEESLNQVPKTFWQIFKERSYNLLEYLPMIYNEEEYQYRIDLEKREKELVERLESAKREIDSFVVK